MAVRRPAAIRSAWFATRFLLGSHAVTFPLLRYAPAPYARVMVEAGMDACIEGLPRSANSFGTIYFRRQNPDSRIAHHMHMPMQFVRAAALGVPCAVLIREPLPNLTSLLIAYDGRLSQDLAFRTYIHYFRRIAEVRDQLALCRFQEVLDDPTVIARRLNEIAGGRFNTEPLDRDQIIDELAAESAAQPSHGIVPNEYKDSRKPAMTAALSGHGLLAEAEAAYAEVAAGLPGP